MTDSTGDNGPLRKHFTGIARNPPTTLGTDHYFFEGREVRRLPKRNFCPAKTAEKNSCQGSHGKINRAYIKSHVISDCTCNISAKTFDVRLETLKKLLKKKRKAFYNNNVNHLRHLVSSTLHEPMAFPLIGKLNQY